MNQRRALLMMALAILFGLIAVALAARWLLRQPAASVARVVVAATEVNLGQRLTPDQLKVVEWPAANLPSGAFDDPVKLHGRVVRTTLLRGEPLAEAKLAPQGTLGGLSALIAEGKRAITVRVNDVVGVAGFALPGNYVDVLVYTQQGELQVSKIVLEHILVLAVAQEVGRDDTKPRVVNAVTLEVTPEQAERLDLGRGVGTLSLVLRNQVDGQPVDTSGATKRSLLALAEPAPPAPVPVRGAAPVQPASDHCVGVINGLSTSRDCFQ